MADIKDTVSPELERIKQELPKKARELVKESGERAEEVIKANTPQSGITFAQRQQVRDSRKPYYTDSLVNSVYKTGISGAKQFEPRQRIGYDDDNGWRAHFTNHGTKHQKGQKFIEKSRAVIIKETEEIIERGIKEVFN